MKSSESKLKFTFINNDLDSIRLNPNLKGNDRKNSSHLFGKGVPPAC